MLFLLQAENQVETSGSEPSRVAKDEEEVFDSNLSVSKSPDWGLATPDQIGSVQHTLVSYLLLSYFD